MLCVLAHEKAPIPDQGPSMLLEMDYARAAQSVNRIITHKITPEGYFLS